MLEEEGNPTDPTTELRKALERSTGETRVIQVPPGEFARILIEQLERAGAALVEERQRPVERVGNSPFGRKSFGVLSALCALVERNGTQTSWERFSQHHPEIPQAEWTVAGELIQNGGQIVARGSTDLYFMLNNAVSIIQRANHAGVTLWIVTGTGSINEMGMNNLVSLLAPTIRFQEALTEPLHSLTDV